MWKLNPEIAYETGLHIGDGNMYSRGNMNRITYCGNLRNEADFYRFLRKFLKNLYGIDPIYIERFADNTVILIVNSKSLLEFKRNVLNIPAGPKDHIGIPEKIRKNERFAKSFMCGLADTDFSLSFKKDRKGLHREPRLEWYTKSKTLSMHVQKILRSNGFSFSVEKIDGKYHGYFLRMYGHKNLDLWLNKFGFKNYWILKKIQVWRKLGFYPIRSSFDDLNKILNI